MVIDVEPPYIHTKGGTAPCNTEEPSESKGLDGECMIKKLYYTEVDKRFYSL